jgi:HAD superfamily hydrolase (TIGR01490 family)
VEAAFFDLDKTILARSGGLALGRNFYREGLISKRLLLRGMASQIVYLLMGADENKMEKMRERALELTKGWHKAKVEQIVGEVMGDVLEPIIYKEALELIRKHQDEGRRVYIVSSSPEEIVLPLAKLLGVDGTLASRVKVDDEGRYTGEIEFYCFGKNKAEAMEELASSEGIDLDGSYAYTDSATDLPMLEVVGHPVGTNAERDLRRIAAKRGWEMVRFEKPITIRKRLAGITPEKRTVAVTSGLALSGAIAAFLLLRRRYELEKNLTLPKRLQRTVIAPFRHDERRKFLPAFSDRN